MRIVRPWLLALPVLAACAAAKPAEAPAPTAATPPTTATQPAALTPPPAIPRQGDPGDAELTQARLESASCAENDAAESAELEARIAQMRQEVDIQYQAWREESALRCVPLRWIPRPTRDVPTVTSRSSGFGAGKGRLGGEATPRPAAPVQAGSYPSKKKERSTSKTNTQVAGVDEADLVKTDGDYLYIASGTSLRIVSAEAPRTVSVTKLNGHVRQLFVMGDRLVAYVVSAPGPNACTYGYDCEVAGDGSSTDVIVLDVRDRAAPQIKRTLSLSGSLIAARRIGDAIHTVVADNDLPPPTPEVVPDVPWCGVTRAQLPRFKQAFEALKTKNEAMMRKASSVLYPTLTEDGTTTKLCDVLRTPLADGKAFTTLMSFDLGQRARPVTATVRSRPGTVFASEQGLFLAVRHQRAGAASYYRFYDSESEVSDLHRFQIGPFARVTRYTGSGVIPGHVLNQFAMDERGGVLRVATTKGRVPSPNVESTISMMVPTDKGNLVRVASIDHLAPGEDIRAVRFDDDRGYVVTFKKTDPLFVLDLADPMAPKVLGELKIPGFSTYMHRIDRDHLLSIGFDADDHGDFAYFNGLLLQIFDVKNPTEPRLLHRTTLGTRGSSSAAATDHLAFTYMPERNLLAIPATVCEGGGDGRNGTLAFSGLVLYDTSIEHGFRRLGGIDHGTRGANCSIWWSQANTPVKRSVIIDDTVFSIATDHLRVQDLKRLGTDLAMISLHD